MPDKFRSLTDILKKDKAFARFRKSVTEQDVLTEFSEIFPSLRKTVIAQNINKGILYLTVENSVLRNEIYLNKNKLLEKINLHFGEQLVADVKFTNFRNLNRNTK